MVRRGRSGAALKVAASVAAPRYVNMQRSTQFFGRGRVSYAASISPVAGVDMSSFDTVVAIFRDTLQLGARASNLRPDSPLLGGIPEFDSMAVVTVVTMIEDQLGVSVDDDELSADVFTTVGSLADFVDRKLAS
jgi:acyl carrier protein